MHVEQHDIGSGRSDGGNSFLRRCRLTDDLERRIALPCGTCELGAHAGTDERMVVDEHDADRGHLLVLRGMRISTSVPAPGRLITVALPPARSLRPMIESVSP